MATEYITKDAAIDMCDDDGDIIRIRNIPAADVRPVVRGEWTRVDYEPCGHDYICSECGCKSDGPWNFCHDCGADMRGDRLIAAKETEE